jgi:hypothetical protein
MKIAIAIALGLLVLTAVGGTVVAIGGATEMGWFIWMAGGIASSSIVFLAPWLIRFSASGGRPDVGWR